MKNLFKKLMLVAVAAMAFAACSQDVNEVNKIEKVTRYEFTANFADTRSGFAEKEEGATAYKSEWFGDDTLKVCANGAFASAQTIKVEDAEGHFTVEFTGDNVPSMIDVYSPASAWNSENYPTIPAVQTPGAHSVDPAAHILKAQAASVESGVVTLQHMVAYGKMTVNGVDFKINKVEVSFNGGTTYTINATNVENNTFWFAISENLTVSEFTVTAYGEGDSVVTKTVSMEGKEKPLAFSWGRVSTFSVSGLEAPAAAALSFGEAYVDPENADYATEYDQYIIFNGGDLGKLFLNLYDADVEILTEDGALKARDYILTLTDKLGVFCGEYNGNAVIEIEMTVSWVNGEYHIVFKNACGYNYKVFFENATYTGAIEGLALPSGNSSGDEPVNPEPVEDSFKYLGRSMELDSDPSSSGGDYVYEVVADGVQYILGIYYPYVEDDGAIKYGTYNYVYNALDTMYGGWDGFVIAYTDKFYYNSTLKADENGVALHLVDANGNLIGDYTFPDAPTASGNTGGGTGDGGETGEVTELNVTSLYAGNFTTDYCLSFYLDNTYNTVYLDVMPSTYNTSGTYSFASQGDTSNGFAGYETHQYIGTPIDSGTLIVTVNGSTRIFDFTFMVGGKTYHFNYTHTATE